MHDQEIEIKLAVDDLAAVEQKLKAVGATLKAERVLERNVRYENAEKTLTEERKVVRMRQDTRARLTWKEPTHGEQVESANIRTELEVTVSDYDTMDMILQKLGYAPHWRYEKYRTTYILNDCEVTLDELPFGNFVEIEGERDQLIEVQKTLELTDHKNISQSYSELMRLLKKKIELPFDDLTFENFRDVSVPAAWWK